MWAILLLSFLLFQNTLGDLVVQLQDGKVQGTTIDTPSGQTFYAWRGIPYAKPPTQELRFLAPVKPEPWDDVRDASQDSPACVFFGVFPGDPAPTNGNSEDCLYANVYSPVSSAVNASLPVLVWIYGGGFYSGFSSFNFYDPTPFLEENVIVVSFNYRLGTLGFLSTGDNVVSGNAGLKDQVMALQWTKDNIAAFGGSPQDIVIFGESAGGLSVGYHVVSPLSRNLFKGAIMESGSALASALTQTDARAFAVSLASQIDASITNASTSDDIRDVLQAVSADVLVKLTNGASAAVVREPESDSAFLSQPLYETIAVGDVAKVPVIIGFTSEEALAFTGSLEGATQMATQYDSNLQLLIPSMPLKENVDREAIGQEIRQVYVGKDGLFADNIAKFLEYDSDNIFVRSSIKQAILHSKFAPAYMYQFSFYGTLSKDNYIVPGAGKVTHAQELGYLFNISTKPIETEADFLTRRRFVKLWTNFAKTLNPTPDDDSADLLQNVKWEPITADNVTYIDIDDNLEIKPSRKVVETAFWDYLWETYSFHPYNTF